MEVKKKKRKSRKKQKVVFAPNIVTLSLNAMESCGVIGLNPFAEDRILNDLFQNPRLYRKKGDDVSR